MSKAKKMTVYFSVSVLIVAIIAFAVILYYKININENYDDKLFYDSIGSSTVEYYCNSSSPGEEYSPELLSEIALSDSKKIWIPIDEVSEFVLDGFIAVEDRCFYTHSGVNIPRSIYALINNIFHFKKSFGASTITQQVVKNISGDNEVSIKRKFNEMLRAFHMENNHSKDEIFELYINIIPMGHNLYGINAASHQYFGKPPSKLSLSEAATLIGITNAPSRYDPYLNAERCKEKRNSVLFAMYEFGKISEDEYTLAVTENLSVVKNDSNHESEISWFLETVNEDVAKALSEKYNISYHTARAWISRGGMKIYTTQNKLVQNELESYFSNEANFPNQINDGLQYSIPALYKGIMYSQSALEEVEEMLSNFAPNQIKELRYNIPKLALQAKINNKAILPICKELAEIAYYSLKTEGENEEQFIIPLIELLKKGKCPAEV